MAIAAVEVAKRSSRSTPWAWLWLFPILFRLLLLLTEPTLSDDVYRYLWDGHLIGNGVNPYRYPVEALELDRYDVGLRSQVNNPGLATPYLPAAQGLFAAIAALFPLTATSVQATMIAFDLATAGLIVALLSRVNLPTDRVALYLWNPLVIVEIAHGAHLDAFMIALTLGAVLASPHRRSGDAATPPWSAAVGPLLLAAATLTRGLPALAVAVLWWRWTWPQRLLYGAASAVPILVFARGPGLGLGPEALESGTGVFGTVRAYGQRWQFNGSIFNWVLRVLDGPDGETRARLVVGLAMGLVALFVAYRVRGGSTSTRTDLRAISVLMMAYVLLTTTVHPWYLLILMALLPFWTPAEGRTTPAARAGDWMALVPWYYLAAALSLSYLTYLDPDAHAELAWVRRVEWWPTLALLGAWLIQRARSGQTAGEH